MTTATDTAGKGPAGMGAVAAGIALAVILAWLALLLRAVPQPSVAALPLVPILAVVGATLVLACIRGRRWAIGLLFIFAFFGLSFGMRMDGYARTGGMDVENIIKLSSWLLVFLICPFHVRRLLPFLRERTVLLACLYGLVAFVSAAWSLIPAYTAANALGLASYIILACLVVSVLGPDATLRLLTLTLLVFITIGLISGVVFPDIAWLPPSVEEHVYRLRGFSGHPNVLGAQAALLATFALILKRRKVIGWTVLVASLVVGFAAIMAADSRTMLAATAGTWLVIALRERRLLAPALLFGSVFAFLAVVLLALGRFPDLTVLLGPLARTGSINEVVTLTGRTELWAVSFDLIKQKPLFGWGFGGTEALLIESVGRGFQGAPVNAHNMYIQAVFNLGFIGALPAFGMLALLLWRMLSRPDAARDQLVLLVMVIGLTEVSIFALPVLLTFSFFLILAREAVMPEARS